MKGKRVGYVRVSSVDQNTVRQLEGIRLDRVFTDKASGKDTKRPQLEAMLEFVRPCHGTDHDFKLLPSPSRIRLPARPLPPRQEQHRSGRPTARGLGGGLLGVPPAGTGVRSSSRTALRVYSSVGLSGFLAVPHATRRLPELG